MAELLGALQVALQALNGTRQELHDADELNKAVEAFNSQRNIKLTEFRLKFRPRGVEVFRQTPQDRSAIRGSIRTPLGFILLLSTGLFYDVSP